MRKTVIIIGIAAVIWIAWLIWPLTALYGLARAVEARDVPAIAAQIDAAAIRRSLRDQIVDTYSRVTGAKVSRSSLLVAVASSVADPLLARIVSAEGMAILLQTGWVNPELVERPSDAQGLNRQALGDAWQIFLNSQRGLDRYSISFPANKPMAERFELEWRMRGPKWRLASVRLPNQLVERMAQQLAKTKQGR